MLWQGGMGLDPDKAEQESAELDRTPPHEGNGPRVGDPGRHEGGQKIDAEDPRHQRRLDEMRADDRGKGDGRAHRKTRRDTVRAVTCAREAQLDIAKNPVPAHRRPEHFTRVLEKGERFTPFEH